MKKLSMDEMKKVIGGVVDWEEDLGDDSGGGGGRTFKYGECQAPVVGAWTYGSPVSLATCQNDVWIYCSNQAGRCYN